MKNQYCYGILNNEVNNPKIFIFKNVGYRDEWINCNFPYGIKIASKDVHHNMSMKRSEVRRRIYEAKEYMESTSLRFIELTSNNEE